MVTLEQLRATLVFFEILYDYGGLTCVYAPITPLANGQTLYNDFSPHMI